MLYVVSYIQYVAYDKYNVQYNEYYVCMHFQYVILCDMYDTLLDSVSVWFPNIISIMIPSFRQRMPIAGIQSRHCEVRSNLMLRDGLSVNEIASYLAMTAAVRLLRTSQ